MTEQPRRSGDGEQRSEKLWATLGEGERRAAGEGEGERRKATAWVKKTGGGEERGEEERALRSAGLGLASWLTRSDPPTYSRPGPVHSIQHSPLFFLRYTRIFQHSFFFVYTH